MKSDKGGSKQAEGATKLVGSHHEFLTLQREWLKYRRDALEVHLLNEPRQRLQLGVKVARVAENKTARLQNQLDLQLVISHNVFLLPKEFRHVPGA